MPLNSVEPPCTDPYARWCGRGGAARLPPIPIALRPQRVTRADTPLAPAPGCLWPSVSVRPATTGRPRLRRDSGPDAPTDLARLSVDTLSGRSALAPDLLVWILMKMMAVGGVGNRAGAVIQTPVSALFASMGASASTARRWRSAATCAARRTATAGSRPSWQGRIQPGATRARGVTQERPLGRKPQGFWGSLPAQCAAQYRSGWLLPGGAIRPARTVLSEATGATATV